MERGAPSRGPIRVLKFGGTSVGSVERIQRVAEIVQRQRATGEALVVVVSAMAGETNRLLALAREAVAQPAPRELDALLATGEQVTAPLLAMVLEARGVSARSLLGHQMGLRTTDAFTRARILGLDRARLLGCLEAGEVVVAAGFQGVSAGGEVTTLGRGGSDTTAVAIAAELGALSCDIYTDVDGVYSADPRICPDARRLERVSYEVMLELASTGAKVLHLRSVELAMRYGVPVRVRSSFVDAPGTLVTQEDEDMEKVLVAGVSCDENEAKIQLLRVPDQPGIATKVFTPLAEAGVVVDMIIQNGGRDGTTDLTFTVPRGDLETARQTMRAVEGQIGFADLVVDDQIAKVSLVGVGMRSHAAVATRMFQALAAEGINIQMISTSEIKISVVLQAAHAREAVRVLHRCFELGAPA